MIRIIITNNSYCYFGSSAENCGDSHLVLVNNAKIHRGSLLRILLNSRGNF